MNDINPTLFKNFRAMNIGNSLDRNEAARFDMEDEFEELAEALDTNEIDLEDFSDEILEKLAVAYNTEMEKKTETKDKEKQKEDDRGVKKKNEAGV